jgi:uncharacterized protein YecE (DUF72 family)
MRRFFDHSRPDGVRYAWEPRGKWPEPLIQEVCSELELIHVVDPFKAEPVTAAPYYFRVLGKRGRGFSFTDEQLGELATVSLLEEEAFVFFNHLEMLADAARFEEMITRDT